MIYDLYTQGMGYNAIAYRLNQLNIPSHTGRWGATSITNILHNEVYLGQIRWRHDPVKKVVKDEMLTKKRVYNPDYELYEGRHEAIITEEQWERVKEMQASRNNVSLNVGRELKNPFATILRCEHCGAPMKRKIPAKGQKTPPWFACPNPDCHSRNIKCETVENAIVDAMRDWLENYTIQLQQEPQSRADTTETELEAVRGQLVQLQAQQDSICEYLEKGIYTVDMFTKRNSVLSRDIKKLQATEAALLKRQASGKKNDRAQQELIPLTQHILDNYALLTVPEKNRLWKLVMKKATICKGEDDAISLHIYPNIPK